MNINDLNYKFNENIVYKSVASSDESSLIIAHNPETGDMYEFNDVGSELFEMLRNNLSIKAIIQNLANEYHAEISDIHADIIPFIERFIELGLIDIDGEGVANQE